ncbi:copper chaperone PCu(A)C [Streptomyces sp. HNM0575]|uniref:DUF461 domain-containing protein n=1 Tax=Streptomyces sp. HNM0575 TaxID=2716338 RepID=UPI00145FB5EA|nr:DUF461 domain-containing protein [Streptomyces sp. HNM0575]NLU74128.1 copper chaperone PCu(A)C [Streptomyces sp. HNM0575]
MSSSIRRGTLAATVLALAVVTLSACEAGHDAQTLEVKPDSAATSVGSVKVQNVTIITPAAGEGPSAVTGRIFNQGTKDETLTSVKVKGTGERVKLRPAEGEKALTVPAGGSLALGGKDNASAELPPGAEMRGVRNGNAQQVSFDLSRTGVVTLRAAVVPSHGDYRKFGPTVAPSPSTTSATPSGSPSGSASESPGSPAGENSSDEKAGKGQEDASESASPSGSDAEHADGAH